MTQAESGPRGQFLGAINDEPTERGHTRIFACVVFCTCTILNPGITRENILSEGTFMYL